MLVCQTLLRVAQRTEQAVQLARALQLAQVLRVRRRNVHRHVARVRIHALQAIQVIVDSALDGRVGVLADVQAEHATRLAPLRCLHVIDERIDTAVVETHAIDERIGRRQAEHARARVAWLRTRCDRADFNKTETERAERIDIRTILVKASSQPHWIGKHHAHHRARLRGYASTDAARKPHRVGPLELVQREVMRVFGIHRKQQRAGKRVQGVEHDRNQERNAKGGIVNGRHAAMHRARRFRTRLRTMCPKISLRLPSRPVTVEHAPSICMPHEKSVASPHRYRYNFLFDGRGVEQSGSSSGS